MYCAIRIIVFSGLMMVTIPAALADVDFEKSKFHNRVVLTAIPEEPSGLVFLFHGTGGSAKYATRNAVQPVNDRLKAAGYALVASESRDHERRNKWLLGDASPESNLDIAYMIALHQHLVESTAIKETTPVFTMGMSNGGGFAILFGYVASANGVPIAAIANYMGPIPSSSRAMFETGVPMPPLFVIAAQNDGIVSLENVRNAVDMLKESGTRIEYHVVRPKAVTTLSLLETGLTEEEPANWLATFLLENGYVDVSGKRLFHKGEVLTRERMKELYTVMKEQGFVRDDLNALLNVWAAHQMRSDFAGQQLAFFNRAMLALP